MRSLEGIHCNAWEGILYKSNFVLERENEWVYEKHLTAKVLKIMRKIKGHHNGWGLQLNKLSLPPI